MHLQGICWVLRCNQLPVLSNLAIFNTVSSVINVMNLYKGWQLADQEDSQPPLLWQPLAEIQLTLCYAQIVEIALWRITRCQVANTVFPFCTTTWTQTPWPPGHWNTSPGTIPRPNGCAGWRIWSFCSSKSTFRKHWLWHTFFKKKSYNWSCLFATGFAKF